MRIEVISKMDETISILVERQKGIENNIRESITLQSIEGLSDDEIKTAAWLKIKPIAIRVFEAIEPLDEEDAAEGFNMIPSRTVKTEVFVPSEIIVETEAYATKQHTDQYGQITSEIVTIDTSTLGTITVEGKSINIINAPAPEPTSEDYLLELDYRLSKIEMGV